MNKLSIYCKSYINDLERVKILIESIEKNNDTNIPVIISVPYSDVKDFRKISNNITVIPDEEIALVNNNNSGWFNQQIIKSSFWKINPSENYLCIDSDSKFLKPFKLEDFINLETEYPYTVIHEQKELFTWTSKNKNVLGFDPKISFEQDRKKIMDIFNRKGKIYDFGPTPVIWNNNVWKDLEEKYLLENNIKLEDLFSYCPSELTWYGESLLKFKTIPIQPIEPLFKVFHYPQQLIEYKKNNITLSQIAENYFGIVMQSNYNAPLNYD